MSTYTDEQKLFIDFEGDDSIVLSAVAGSGKTHSAVGKLNKMLANGIDAKRIIFFSFTNDAVDELKTRINADVRITTIHSYTSSMLARMGKFKPIVTFYDFAAWYKEKHKPKGHEAIHRKMAFQETMNKFYEDGAQISTSFGAFKLQSAENLSCHKPKYYDDYRKFLTETKSRDFSDLLIETEKLSRDEKFKHYFEGTYDYVFVDEYQDTSSLQMKILLTINAKQYYVIGDKNQSIYGFSGANCDAIEAILREKHPLREFTLTQNFRSDRLIVEHANKFSELKAIPFSENPGKIVHQFINEFDLYEMMEDGEPLTVLVRTNAVIKEIEKQCLKKKIKMKYFNYLTAQDIDHIEKGNINAAIKKKLDAVAPYYGNPTRLLAFIEEHKKSKTYVTSIHKSKGREYPRVVVVNSCDPEQLVDTDYDVEDFSFVDEHGEIDIEARNVHYVAVTRPKQELYFLIYEK